MVAVQAADEAIDVDKTAEIEEGMAVSVGLFSGVSGWDVSIGSGDSDGSEVSVGLDGSDGSDGDGVISGSTREVRDPVEMACEVNSVSGVDRLSSEVEGLEGAGVISGLMEDVGELVETL